MLLGSHPLGTFFKPRYESKQASSEMLFTIPNSHLSTVVEKFIVMAHIEYIDHAGTMAHTFKTPAFSRLGQENLSLIPRAHIKSQAW